MPSIRSLKPRHSPQPSASSTTTTPEPDYSRLYTSLRRKHTKRTSEESRERLHNTSANATNGAGWTGTAAMGGSWAAAGAGAAAGNGGEEEEKKCDGDGDGDGDGDE